MSWFNKLFDKLTGKKEPVKPTVEHVHVGQAKENKEVEKPKVEYVHIEQPQDKNQEKSAIVHENKSKILPHNAKIEKTIEDNADKPKILPHNAKIEPAIKRQNNILPKNPDVQRENKQIVHDLAKKQEKTDKILKPDHPVKLAQPKPKILPKNTPSQAQKLIKSQQEQLKTAIAMQEQIGAGKLTIHPFKSLKLGTHRVDEEKPNFAKQGVNAIDSYVTKDGYLIDPTKKEVYKFGNKDFFNKFKQEAKFDKNGLIKTPINSQGLLQIEKPTQAKDKKALIFMAGPMGSEIAGQKMQAGETTGKYLLDKQSWQDMQDDFHGNLPKYWQQMFDLKNDKLVGINTYVDPKSSLTSERHFPRHTKLYNSKLITKDTWPKHENQVYVAFSTLKNSNLKLKDEYCIENTDLNNVQMPRTSQAWAFHAKLNSIALGKNTHFEDTVATGGKFANSYLTNVAIKQNSKSCIENTKLEDTAITKDDFNKDDLEKPDSMQANLLKNVNAKNSVIHSNSKNPVLLEHTNLQNVQAVNGLAAQNSSFKGSKIKPIELDGVESANNSVTAKHEFKLNGKLPEDQVINDEDKHDKEIDPTDGL